MFKLSLKVMAVLMISFSLLGCENEYEPVEEDATQEWETPPPEEEMELPEE